MTLCGPCGDGICDWMDCTLPGLCDCDEHEPDEAVTSGQTPT